MGRDSFLLPSTISLQCLQCLRILTRDRTLSHYLNASSARRVSIQQIFQNLVDVYIKDARKNLAFTVGKKITKDIFAIADAH